MQNTSSMGVHHLAFATRDAVKTYQFYHDRLGMRLVRTEDKLMGAGHVKHFFFEIGAGQYIAFFELHDAGENPDYRTDVNRALGLPGWVNHVAFRAPDETSYQALKQRCLDQGVHIISEMNHGWCLSFYFKDPNGITLEFTYDCDPQAFEQDPETAYQMLLNAPPAILERRRLQSA